LAVCGVEKEVVALRCCSQWADDSVCYL